MIAFCMGRWLLRYDLQVLQSGDEAGGSAAFVPWESEVEVSAVWAGADAEAEGEVEGDSRGGQPKQPRSITLCVCGFRQTKCFTIVEIRPNEENAGFVRTYVSRTWLLRLSLSLIQGVPFASGDTLDSTTVSWGLPFTFANEDDCHRNAAHFRLQDPIVLAFLGEPGCERIRLPDAQHERMAGARTFAADSHQIGELQWLRDVGIIGELGEDKEVALRSHALVVARDGEVCIAHSVETGLDGLSSTVRCLGGELDYSQERARDDFRQGDVSLGRLAGGRGRGTEPQFAVHLA